MRGECVRVMLERVGAAAVMSVTAGCRRSGRLYH